MLFWQFEQFPVDVKSNKNNIDDECAGEVMFSFFDFIVKDCVTAFTIDHKIIIYYLHE